MEKQMTRTDLVPCGTCEAPRRDAAQAKIEVCIRLGSVTGAWIFRAVHVLVCVPVSDPSGFCTKYQSHMSHVLVYVL